MPLRRRCGLVPAHSVGVRGDERGSAMILALLLVLLVTLIGATAVSESIQGTYRSAVTNKAVEVVAAGRGGIDAEIASLEKEASTGGPLTCAGGQTQLNGVGSGAANAASVESYQLTFYATGETASAAVQSLTNGLGSSCATNPNITPGSGTWYLALEASGSTASSAYSSAIPAIAVVEFQQNQTQAFTEALYTGAELDASNDDFTVLKGDANGNVYVGTSLDASTSTDVQGLLLDNGNVRIKNGTYKFGSVVSNGSVTIASTGTTSVGGGVDAVGAVSLPNNGSSAGGSVYAEDGAVTNAGMTVGGGSYGNTAWPGCPAGVATCIANTGGPGYVAKPPPFPEMTFSPSEWPGYTVYQDTETNCSGNVVSSWDPLSSATDTADRYESGVANIGTYQKIWYATTNTVVVTPCAVVISDFGGNVGTLSMSHNLAIFAAGGIVLSNNTTVSGGSGDSLYLITPCASTCYNSGNGPFPSNGETMADCNAIGNSTTAPEDNMNADGTTSTGDIWFDNTPQNVHTFIYTPDNLCMSSSPTLTGQVYVGGSATGTSVAFTLTEDDTMSSSFTSGAGSFSVSNEGIYG